MSPRGIADLLIYNENGNRPQRIRGQSQCHSGLRTWSTQVLYVNTSSAARLHGWLLRMLARRRDHICRRGRTEGARNRIRPAAMGAGAAALA
eukprot:COSAG06_NODE_851_length_11957_cov_6.770048_11_plen_92_part_00